MGVSITDVTTRADRRRFIRLPWRIYRGDPNWVPPLQSEEAKRIDPDRNPFLAHVDARFLLAWRDGEPVGRIVAHIDHLYNDTHNERTGFFGLFEAIREAEVAEALFTEAADWLRDQGMARMLGPFVYNTNGESGLLVEGFDTPPALLMPYNPRYYPELMEANGFAKAKDLVAYTVQLDGQPFQTEIASLLPRLQTIGRRAREQGYAARALDLGDFDGEVERLREIYNEAWEANWGFVPLTRKEFEAEAREMRRIVDPELGVLIEQGREPVAFALMLPDLNQAIAPANGRLVPLGWVKILWHQRRIDGVRLLTLGIKHRHRVRGVDALLYEHLIRAIRTRPQYRWCECSWILEDNRRMRQIIERVRGEVTKTYRVYERPL